MAGVAVRPIPHMTDQPETIAIDVSTHDQPDQTVTAPAPAPAVDATPASDVTTPAVVAVETEPRNPIDIAIDALRAAEKAVAVAAEQAGQPVPVVARERFNMTKPRVIEPVPIELDKTRHLMLPFWALMEFEDLTGISPWDNERVFNYPPNLKILTTLLWCALREEEPGLTLEQTRRLPGLEFGQVYYILHCLDLCWGRNAPEPDKAGQNGAGKPDPNRFAVVPTG